MVLNQGRLEQYQPGIHEATFFQETALGAMLSLEVRRAAVLSEEKVLRFHFFSLRVGRGPSLFMPCYNSNNSQCSETGFKHASSSTATQIANSADSIFRQSMDFAPGDSWSPAFHVKDAWKYVLSSVVNHHGTIDSGHYTSYVRLRDAQCNPSAAAKSADLKGTKSEKWTHSNDAELTLF